MFLIAIPQLYAQDATFSRELLFRQHSVRDGLSQSTVNSIVQDRIGYIWLATDDGLNRYDGVHFKNFRPSVSDSTTISSVDILKIQLSMRGDIIVGSRSGDINIWDPVSGKTKHRPFNRTGEGLLPLSQFYDLSEDRYGRIWVATDSGLGMIPPDRSGLFKIDDSALRKLGKPLQYYAVTEIENEVYWLGVLGVGLVQFNYFDRSFSVLIDQNEESYSGIVPSTIFKESNGNIWVGTRQHGVLHWKSGIKKWQVHSTKTSTGLGSDFVSSFVEDLEGNVWVGTANGMALYNEDEKRFLNFSVEKGNADGLLENEILNIFIDKSNNLWLGTRQRGVFVADLKKQKFENISFVSNNFVNTKKDGKIVPVKLPNYSNVVWSFGQDNKQNIWVGTESGLFKLDSNLKFLEIYHPRLGEDNIHRALKGSYIGALRNAGDDLWIGVFGEGLQKYNLKNSSMDFVDPVGVTGQSLHGIVNVIESKYGKTWIGSFAGLFTVDSSDTIQEIFPQNIGKETGLVWDIEFDSDDNLWIVSDLGVFVYHIPTSAIKEIVLNPVLKQNVNSVLLDSSFVWLSTTFGLFKIDRKDDSRRLYTEVDGLANNFVYGGLKAHDGELWFSTNKGLSRVRYSYQNQDSISFRNYAHLDGVYNLEYDGGAFYKTKQGHLLFGGISGVDVILPENVYDNPFEPTVVVNEFTVFEGATGSTVFPAEGRPTRLSHLQNVFTIDVAALEFTQPELNRFAYKLEPFDKAWIYSNKKPFIVYTNLDPGKYVLKVRASNNDGVWAARPLEIPVEIIPPFWQTMPFYAFCLLIVFSGVAMSVNMRERKLKMQNVQLEERVSLRTKELQESEEIFRLISESAADLISIIDEKGNLLYANPAHLSILGYRESELVGSSFYGFMHPEDVDRNRKYFLDLLMRGKSSFPDYRIRHKNGSWLVFASSASRVAESGQGRQRFVILSHDYSKQREITEQLTRSKEEAEQASRSKSAFLASMSHELKTPLNSILGFTQILQEDKSLPERHKNHLATMYESGKHLLKMIEEVLDLSKIEAGRMQVNRIDFELDQLFKELDARTRKRIQSSNIQYNRFISPEIPALIHGDYEKLVSVSYNLLDNAIKHAEKGSILLDVRYFPNMPVRRKPIAPYKHLDTFAPVRPALSSREMIRIVIQDSGSGIKAEELDAIFRPFNKSNPSFSQGIGLGLAISWRLISLMDGWLEIFAEEGAGTEIHVWIPVILPTGSVFAAKPAQTNSTQAQDQVSEEQDSLGVLINTIQNLPDEAMKNALVESIDLMDAEMLEKLLSENTDDRLSVLALAAKNRNFSLLITLNERLNPVS